ncbi:TetR/AcrR family transcriptional regulator [Nocardia sp. NPDC050697]|uniref:TetR/AcrR family transcriptional regulator n=1 Tax=Nocardia sp. NPDC050697 TaxID=3155158 RepID=UPI0033CF1A28
MTDDAPAPPNRLARRKARTRAALVRAAQDFLADGRLNAPILEITQAADVGMGSFYNHFDSREALYSAAITEALDSYGDWFDSLTEDLPDPAQVFAQGFRLTGRLHRIAPTLSKILLNNASVIIGSDRGLAPRARRDIEAGIRAGRFRPRDLDPTMAVVVGAALCLGHLLHDHPERDEAGSVDQVAEDLLCMLGVSIDEAREICALPLPTLATPTTLGAA